MTALLTLLATPGLVQNTVIVVVLIIVSRCSPVLWEWVRARSLATVLTALPAGTTVVSSHGRSRLRVHRIACTNQARPEAG